MKAELVWKEKMEFVAKMGTHQITLDALSPLGSDHGPTPKEILLAAIDGCSAMDVISLMKKHKQIVQSMRVESEATKVKTHPQVFERVDVRYILEGDIKPEILLESVNLSMTRYCGVSAMVNKVSPIYYSVVLNGREIGQGQANFNLPTS